MEIVDELNIAWGKNNSYSGLLDVIKKRSLEKIGEGSSRMVFKLDNDKCIKIAKNKFGIAQMTSECKISENGFDEVFTKVFEYDHEFHIWSICELCRTATDEDFEKILGVPFSIIEAKIEDLIYDFKEDNYEEIDSELEKSPKAVEFMNKLVSTINAAGLHNTAYDFEMVENYGVTSDGSIKIIDYGLDDESAKDMF